MIKNKLTILIICVVCLLTILMCGYAAMPSADFDADVVEIVPVYKDGIRVADGIKIGETTYTQLRAFLDSVEEELDISWDSETATASVIAEGLDFSVTVGNQYMVANGRYLYIPDGAVNYDGSIIVPIRAIAEVFNAEVIWDEETSSITLEIEEISYLEPGDDYYDEVDLYWLSRLIGAESGNQSFDGKVAVGNVVINRISDPTCPDTVYGVIFDNKYGVQFSVTENGTIFDAPNDESVIAAKVCLEGYNLVEGSIYFVNPDIGIYSWFLQTRVFVATIGDHDFYA